jgi:carbonic anhydrase
MSFAMKTTPLWLALIATICLAQIPFALADGETEQLKGIVQNLLQDNNDFVKSHNPDYFKPFIEGQKPRATVVTCSDSRVHTHALDKTPDGDLFMVRNIGNQLRTAEGSVEYGVHHLHTPLLIFIGHSACGAIKAASGDYRKESRPIKRELSTIMIPRGIENMDGVKRNVNNQVAAALRKFRHEINESKLTVVGAIYDFRNDLGLGQGRLTIVNINGSTDGDKIRQFSAVAELKDNAAAVTSTDTAPASGGLPPPYSYP